LAIVQGAWSKLLSPGLIKAFKESEQYYVLSEEEYLTLINRPRIIKAIRELHVYDLGDGMLVPCQLAKEIAAWSQMPTKEMMSKMIEDDLYGSHPYAYIKATADAIDKMILEKATSLFPGKVILVDDPKDSSYLTDPSLWFLLDDAKTYAFDPPKNMMQFYGKSMAEMLSEPKPVKIPKKPKQVTKEFLAYFHKLLGGKKDPYIK